LLLGGVRGYCRGSWHESVLAPYEQMAKRRGILPVTLITHRREVPCLTLSYKRIECLRTSQHVQRRHNVTQIGRTRSRHGYTGGSDGHQNRPLQQFEGDGNDGERTGTAAIPAAKANNAAEVLVTLSRFNSLPNG
jgi:hypothetical protein